ncbi:MAG TPA: sulfotransferase domain-containing protein, partial [Candidatus Gastranaerophilales bacterium]|nr:sulfotransferase domain-containing protein [Candidatus Gastranaerophilales bacterium]
MNKDVIEEIKKYQISKKAPKDGPTTKFLHSLSDSIIENEKQGHQLIVNAMPKSGSSYLTLLLCTLTEYPEVMFHVAAKNTEPTMLYPFLIDLYNKNYVMHHHYKASDHNLFMYNKFKLKPIILTRNIYDIVLSYVDSINAGKHDPFGSWLTFIPPEFKARDEKQQFKMMIDMATQWYIIFYLTWYYANKINNKIEVLWLTYEELVTDGLNTLKKICAFYKIQKTDAEILKLLELINPIQSNPIQSNPIQSNPIQS